MRFEGRLVTWNDERGFGFLESTQGGDPVFVHIKAFRSRAVRPRVGQAYAFGIAPGPDGRKRAVAVEAVRPARVRRAARRDSPAGWGTASLFALPAFLALAIAVDWRWHPPAWILAPYLGLSALSFLAYWLDKEAARAQASRTPESTLHLLALAGGWPGALLAQQLLRHKSAKAAFRRTFWGTVVVNVAAFVLACSQMGVGPA